MKKVKTVIKLHTKKAENLENKNLQKAKIHRWIIQEILKNHKIEDKIDNYDHENIYDEANDRYTISIMFKTN